MAEIRRMDDGSQPEPHGSCQRCPTNAGLSSIAERTSARASTLTPFPGTREPGNDDDKAARATPRGNETITLVRDYLKRPPNPDAPQISNRNRPPENATS